MENVKITVDKDVMTITIDLTHRGQVSDKGNIRVASTLGNKEIPGSGGIILGLNAYVKK